MKIIDPREPGIVSDPVLVRQLMDERARLGIDMFDEVWEGVLHMNPFPAPEHNLIQAELIAFILPLRRTEGLLYPTTGIRPPGSGLKNFRGPDLSFVSNDRAALVAESWIEGAPDAVIEIYSPGDETYEKLPFYAKLGVREAIIIDRDTREVELFRPQGDDMLAVLPAPDGSLVSETLQIVLRRIDGREGRGLLELSDARDPSRRCTI